MNVKGFRYRLVPQKFLSVKFGIRFMLGAFLIFLMNSVEGVALAIVAGFTEEQEKGLTDLLKGVGDKHKELVKTEMEALVTTKGLYTEKEFTTKMEALGIKDKTINDLLESVKKQGEDIQKLFAKNPQGDEHKSVDEVMKENKDKIKELSKGVRAQGFQMHLSNKQVAEILGYADKTLVQRSAISNSTLGMRLDGVGQLPYLDSIFAGLFRHVTVSPDSNGVIRWMEQQAITRGAAMTAENATKGESQITWIEQSASVKKITDSIPVTREAWNDVGFIRGELQTLLGVNLTLKEDGQLYNGDGAGDNLKGIRVYSSEYNNLTGDFYQKVTDPNIYDLVAVLRVAIANGKQSKYSANVAVMNPVDIARMKLAKAADGHYILPPFIAANGMTIDGVVVKESSQVTKNTFVIGDFRYGTIYDLEGVTVDMGYVNDQFIKNATTLLAEKREMLLVKNVDADAFLKVEDIDAAVAALSI